MAGVVGEQPELVIFGAFAVFFKRCGLAFAVSRPAPYELGPTQLGRRGVVEGLEIKRGVLESL